MKWIIYLIGLCIMINVVHALTPLEPLYSSPANLTNNGAVVYNNTGQYYKWNGLSGRLYESFIAMNGNYSFTISARINPSSLNPDGQIIYQTGAERLLIQRFTSNRYRIYIKNATLGCEIKAGTLPYTVGSWQLLTVTYNTTQLTFYVDGRTDASNTVACSLRNELFQNYGINIGSTGAPSRFWNGSIDDVSIYYNRALSATEVLALNASGGVPTDYTGLLAYYPFTNSTDSCSCTAGANWNIVDHCNMVNTVCNVAIVNITATGWLNISGTSILNATKIIWVPRDAEEAFRVRWLSPSKIRWS